MVVGGQPRPRADLKKSIKGICCILLVAYVVVLMMHGLANFNFCPCFQCFYTSWKFLLEDLEYAISSQSEVSASLVPRPTTDAVLGQLSFKARFSTIRLKFTKLSRVATVRYLRTELQDALARNDLI